MKPRLFYAVSPILAVVLAWSLHQAAARATGPAPAAAEAAKATANPVGPAVKIEGRDWAWRLKPDGTVQVLCKGSVVVETGLAFWGPKWKWVSVGKPKLEPASDGWSYAAEIAALKTKFTGDYRSSRPSELEMDLRVTSEEAVPDAIGGGLQWKFTLATPALGPDPGKPALLPGNAGWSWEPTPGQVVRLEIEPAAALASLEGGVRTLLVQGLQVGTRSFRLRLTLPDGATRVPMPDELYDPARPEGWFPEALAWDASPVDLRSLNAGDRPAGGKGRVRADGDRLVLGDGSSARFWGANVVAYALFQTPREVVPVQARRLAQLGYNLIRIHHHDSAWVGPNVFGSKPTTTRRLDESSLEKLDWWIKCLRDEGIYTWLDVEVGRTLQESDGSFPGMDELLKSNKGDLRGYSYFNEGVRGLMEEFQRQYLGHVNVHTGLAYQDDPAIAFILLTNENDVTHHFGHMFLNEKGRPFHGPLYRRQTQAFAREHGLSEEKTWQSWIGGQAAWFLADVEHRFNTALLGDLHGRAGRPLAATTNTWGRNALGSLPPLLDGDVVDAHSYGVAEFLGSDPRYETNYAHWIAAAQVAGRPTTITEWNVEYPNADRFCSPLYTAALAAFQGWDAPMLYAYCQEKMARPTHPSVWSTWCDPSLTGLMPAAALLFRKGQVAPARGGFHMAFPAEQFYRADLSPATSLALRTGMEQRRVTIGVAPSPALPWLPPTPAPEGAEVIEDPQRDLLVDGESGVIRSDTGELTRDWKKGTHVIDAPHCQAASGWIGGEAVTTTDARFDVTTKKATVVLNSVDDRPLSQSRFILISAVARAGADPKKRHPFVSEPVVAAITLKTEVPDLELMALAADGRVAGRSTPAVEGGKIRVEVPSLGGTHWYVLKSKGGPASP